MKLIQIFISLSMLLLLIPTDHSLAQIRELQPLSAKDFKCLQTLECVQNSESLKEKGWSFIFDDIVEKFAQELTAKMKGKKVSFYAVYSKEGDLIESVYKRQNIALPASLLAHLTENELKNSRLTGTEMIMRNFDVSTIAYNVEIENNSNTESNVYDIAFTNNIVLKNKELAGQ